MGSIVAGFVSLETSGTSWPMEIRQYFPQQASASWTYEFCLDQPCRANSTRVRRCSQVQAIEDRLRCFRLQANARREWLQGLAQVVLYPIGVGAAACLLVALL